MEPAALPITESFTYRTQTIRALCVSCNEEAHARCPRCGAPHCATHQPSAQLRCRDCEDFYAAARAERKQRPFAWWMLPLIYLVSAHLGGVATYFVISHGWLRGTTAAIGWAALLFLSVGLLPLWVARLRLLRLRPIFLAEAPARRRVAVPEIAVHPIDTRPSPDTLGIVSASLLGLFFIPFAIPLAGIVLATVSLLNAQQDRVRYSRVAIVALILHALLMGTEMIFLLAAVF